MARIALDRVEKVYFGTKVILAAALPFLPGARDRLVDAGY
jgi:hypothetical protein